MKKKSGFTLVEVVIAISILSIIFGTAYSVITQIISTKRMLDDRRDISTTASSIIRRLSRELQLVIADSGKPLVFINSSKFGGASVYFYGESGNSSSGEGTSIHFLAQEGGQYLPDGGTHTGLVEINYRLVRDPEGDKSDVYSLVREETPYVSLPRSNNPRLYQEALEKARQKRIIFPIAENVVAFDVKYYDLYNDTWVKEWGTSMNEAPAMIHYSVSLVSPLGSVQKYATTVPIGGGR